MELLMGEIRFLRTLRHKNIVFFHGAGVWFDGSPFLVTEYLTMGSLRTVLKSDTMILSASRRLSLALGAATGMHCLHSLDPPRLHRDLKSANILLSEQWVPKVALGIGTRIRTDPPSYTVLLVLFPWLTSYFLQIADFGLSRLMCRQKEISGSLGWSGATCAMETIRGGQVPPVTGALVAWCPSLILICCCFFCRCVLFT